MVKNNIKLKVSPKRDSRKTFQIVLVVLLSFLFGFSVCNRLTWFNDHYEIKSQFPIVLKVPVWVEQRRLISPIELVRVEVTASPSATPSATPLPRIGQPASKKGADAQVISKHKYASLMWGIYGKESTWGKADGCKNKGLFNGYGFRQNTREWKCFESFEEVSTEVENWLVANLAKFDNNINRTLCYYNKGLVLTDCDYSSDVLSLQANI